MTDFEIPESILSLLEKKNTEVHYTQEKAKPQTIKESFYFNKKENPVKSQKLKEFVKFEIKQKTNCETKDNLYPLFRNYPNGSDEYYLKLGSKELKNKIKVLFIGNKIFNRKIYSFLKNNNCLEENNYNYIITTNAEKALSIDSEVPIIFLNCEPKGFLNKKRMFYFYDNLNLFKRLRYSLNSNKINFMYRKNCFDVVEFLYKINQEKSFD
jgi:hypothetical protein